jgi:hypothetical protein
MFIFGGITVMWFLINFNVFFSILFCIGYIKPINKYYILNPPFKFRATNVSSLRTLTIYTHPLHLKCIPIQHTSQSFLTKYFQFQYQTKKWCFSWSRYPWFFSEAKYTSHSPYFWSFCMLLMLLQHSIRSISWKFIILLQFKSRPNLSITSAFAIFNALGAIHLFDATQSLHYYHYFSSSYSFSIY